MTWYHQILNYTDLFTIINASMTWYHQILKFTDLVTIINAIMTSDFKFY